MRYRLLDVLRMIAAQTISISIAQVVLCQCPIRREPIVSVDLLCVTITGDGLLNIFGEIPANTIMIGIALIDFRHRPQYRVVMGSGDLKRIREALQGELDVLGMIALDAVERDPAQVHI